MKSTNIETIANNANISKSEKIRKIYESDNNLNVGDISKILNIRYQFVYNVLDNHTNGNIRKVSKVSKSANFREMYDNGLTIGEISKITNSNYTFVHSVISKYRNNK